MEDYISKHEEMLEKSSEMQNEYVQMLRDNRQDIRGRKSSALKAIEAERRRFDYITVMRFIMLVIVILFVGIGTYYGWSTLSLWKDQTEEVKAQLE